MREFVPVVVSAVAMFILGGLWYSPLLFAKPWVKAMGLDINDKEKMEAMRKSAGPAYVQVFLIAILTSFIFWRLFQFLGTKTALDGAEIAVFVCVGTVVASKYTQALFCESNRMLFLIGSGYQLVSFAVMGAVLGGWQA